MTGNAKRVQSRIRWYAVSSLLLTGVIIALVIMIPFQKRLFDMQQQHLIYSRNVAVLIVESAFDRLHEIAKQISTRMRGADILTQYDNKQISKYKAENSLKGVLKNSFLAHNDLVSITRFDKNAHSIISAGQFVFTTHEMQKLIHEKLFVYEPENQKTNQHYLLSMSTIHNSQGGVIGYDVFTFRIQKLEQMIQEKMQSNLGITYLYFVRKNKLHWLLANDKNNVEALFSSDTALKNLLVSAVLKNKSGVLTENHNKTGAVLTYAAIPGMPWGVVVYASKAYLYHSVQRIVLILAAIVFFILLLFAVGLSLVLRPLSGRLLLQNDELEALVQAGKSELKILNEQLYNLAMHDSLTDLMTRRAFYHRAEEELSRCKRYQRCFALIYVDLNNFKLVNDSIGHDAGDFLLKKIAEHLLKSVRKEDLVARLGGDEFTVLVTEKTDEASLSEILRRIKLLESSVIVYSQHEIKVEMSMGIAIYPDDADTVDALLKVADQRMYQEKQKNHERV